MFLPFLARWNKNQHRNDFVFKLLFLFFFGILPALTVHLDLISLLACMNTPLFDLPKKSRRTPRGLRLQLPEIWQPRLLFHLFSTKQCIIIIFRSLFPAVRRRFVLATVADRPNCTNVWLLLNMICKVSPLCVAWPPSNKLQFMNVTTSANTRCVALLLPTHIQVVCTYSITLWCRRESHMFLCNCWKWQTITRVAIETLLQACVSVDI